MRPLIPQRRRARPEHDPAPSRARYRIQRLWLTPIFRALLRTGIPAFSVVLAITWYIGDPARLEALGTRYAEIRQSIEDRPEFLVTLMTIEGASPELAQDITEVLPIDLPVSQFDLDLDQLRAQLEELDPIRTADVRLKPGGLLALTVTEREPAVLWQTETGLEMLAADGHRVASARSRTLWPDLPLIAGPGAEDHVPEALRLMAAAEPISAQTVGLVRVGERRWDLVLRGERRVMLPEADPGLALDRVLALQDAQDVLSRDVVALDYRNALRPTVRMSAAARQEWLRLKNLEYLSNEDEG